MNQNKSHCHGIKKIVVFTVVLPLVCLAMVRADDILLLEKPAANWG